MVILNNNISWSRRWHRQKRILRWVTVKEGVSSSSSNTCIAPTTHTFDLNMDYGTLTSLLPSTMLFWLLVAKQCRRRTVVLWWRPNSIATCRADMTASSIPIAWLRSSSERRTMFGALGKLYLRKMLCCLVCLLSRWLLVEQINLVTCFKSKPVLVHTV